MIAPILPGAEHLIEDLHGKVDYVLVDRMNYHYADWIYRKHTMLDKLTDEFFRRTGRELAEQCERAGIECSVFT